MKKRNFKWEVVGAELICKDATTENELAKFDAGADFPQSILDQLLAYGLKQKLADSVSDVDDRDEKIAGMSEMYGLLIDGDWERKREGGTRTVSVLVEAVARYKKAPIASVQKALAGFTDEQKKSMAKKPEIAKLIEIITTERGQVITVDLSDLDG